LWLWLVTGATMTRFARGLGTPDWAFGLLVAIPAVATLVQLPASVLLSSGWHPKPLFIVSQLASRGLWLALACIPWIWPGQCQDQWWVMLLVLVPVWALHHAGIPAWMNWMADVVPRSVRGHFYGIRQRVARPVAVAATVAVGWLLDVVQGHDTAAGIMLLRATSLLLMVAALFGILEVLMYRRVKPPAKIASIQATPWWKQLATPLRDRNFRWFIAFSAVMGLSSGFLSQYVWLYMFDEGQYTNLHANLLLVALPGAVNLAVFPFWGRIVDRYGRKPVIVIGLAGMLLNPIGWIVLCTQTNLILGIAIVIVGFCMWPGLELATTNYMFDLAGARDQKTGGTSYVAMNNIAMATAGIISGLIGAGCALWLEDLRWVVPSLGIPITYHGVLFLFAAFLRLMALCCALKFKDAEAAPTRDVMRYMTSSLYGNVRQALFMSIRVVGQPLARAYRLHDDALPEEDAATKEERSNSD